MVLYNLTPSKELTQPWCESSPWGDSDQHAAYIPYRASASAVLPYVLLVLILPTHRGMEGWVNPQPGWVQEQVMNLGPVTWQYATLPTELTWPVHFREGCEQPLYIPHTILISEGIIWNPHFRRSCVQLLHNLHLLANMTVLSNLSITCNS